jgi:hypothetical protein
MQTRPGSTEKTSLSSCASNCLRVRARTLRDHAGCPDARRREQLAGCRGVLGCGMTAGGFRSGMLSAALTPFCAVTLGAGGGELAA